MDQTFDRRQLVPPGFSVLSSEITASGVKIAVAPVRSFGICPCCGSHSERIQSRYQRHVTDLPISGRNVELQVLVRRFWCDAVLCGRRIFCERFESGILAP
jgi:transposase